MKLFTIFSSRTPSGLGKMLTNIFSSEYGTYIMVAFIMSLYLYIFLLLSNNLQMLNNQKIVLRESVQLIKELTEYIRVMKEKTLKDKRVFVDKEETTKTSML